MAWPPAPLPRLEWSETTTVHSYGNSSTGLRNDLRNDTSITSKLPSASNRPHTGQQACEPPAVGGLSLSTSKLAKDSSCAHSTPVDTQALLEAAASATGGALQPQLDTSASATAATHLSPTAPVATPSLAPVATVKPLYPGVEPTGFQKPSQKRAHEAGGAAATGVVHGMHEGATKSATLKRCKEIPPADSVLLESPLDTVSTPFAADLLVRFQPQFATTIAAIHSSCVFLVPDYYRTDVPCFAFCCRGPCYAGISSRR